MSPPPDLHQLWQQADAAQSEAQTRYPDMRCLSGCNDCCKHHGSPITYAREWQAIEAWLLEHPEVLAGIRSRYRALKQSLQARLAEPEAPTLAAALFEIPCPCIDQGRCAIYPVRPLTCRAFGNTLLSAAPTSRDQLYTCNDERDRWERELPMLTTLDLPLREPLFAGLPEAERRSLLSFLERFLATQPA